MKCLVKNNKKWIFLDADLLLDGMCTFGVLGAPVPHRAHSQLLGTDHRGYCPGRGTNIQLKIRWSFSVDDVCSMTLT